MYYLALYRKCAKLYQKDSLSFDKSLMGLPPLTLTAKGGVTHMVFRPSDIIWKAMWGLTYQELRVASETEHKILSNFLRRRIRGIMGHF